MKHDALLFDFDGVLADTERVHHRAWNQTLEPLGIQLDWASYQKNFVGVADEVALRETAGFERSGGSGRPEAGSVSKGTSGIATVLGGHASHAGRDP